MKQTQLERPPVIHERHAASGNYRTLLTRIHKARQPKIYLEIGVARGGTLALATSAELAIGVDPKPHINTELPAAAKVVPLESDRFFADEAEAALGGRKIDFAFVDGLHLFEQVIRDVLNVERFATPQSIIALHDTFPIDEVSARRDRETPWWTGDVWKAVVCLATISPALTIQTAPVAPTGLTLLTSLTPERRLGDADIAALIRHGESLRFADYADRFPEVLKITSTPDITTR